MVGSAWLEQTDVEPRKTAAQAVVDRLKTLNEKLSKDSEYLQGSISASKDKAEADEADLKDLSSYPKEELTATQPETNTTRDELALMLRSKYRNTNVILKALIIVWVLLKKFS